MTKLILKPFQHTWQLLAVLSLPAVLLGWFGLSQLGITDPSLLVPAELVKFLCEFLISHLNYNVIL